MNYKVCPLSAVSWAGWFYNGLHIFNSFNFFVHFDDNFMTNGSINTWQLVLAESRSLLVCQTHISLAPCENMRHSSEAKLLSLFWENRFQVHPDRLAACPGPLSPKPVHLHHHGGGPGPGVCVRLQRVELRSQEGILQCGLPRHFRDPPGEFCWIFCLMLHSGIANQWFENWSVTKLMVSASLCLSVGHQKLIILHDWPRKEILEIYFPYFLLLNAYKVSLYNHYNKQIIKTHFDRETWYLLRNSYSPREICRCIPCT